MRKANLVISLPLLLLVCSCSGLSTNQPSSSSSGSSSSSSAQEKKKVECYVYTYSSLPEMKGTIEYSYSGKDIQIDKTNNTVCGTLANTTTDLTMSNGTDTIEVEVKVLNRDYSSKHTATEASEGWFGSVDVDPITGISDDFASGVDISSSKQLYDAGQRFYNEDGVEESLFRIMADHQVNWTRLRLWNDPYNHNFSKDGEYVSYGGGTCDLENVTWMAQQSKYFGMNLLLDLHFSDFWADPSSQVIPKAWSSFTTSDQMANAISTYVTSVLTHLDENEALPDMVSIGNENIIGILTEMPGTDSSTYVNDNPGYISGATPASEAIAGTISSDNFVKYIKAGVDAVKKYNSSILTMVHMAKGLSAYEYIKKIYDSLASVDYDVIGLSGYSYWHFSKMNVLKYAMDYLSEAFPTKKIALAETSYGFTYETDNNCSNIFSSSGTAKPVSGYDVSIQGQAKILRDTMAQVSSISNGFGVFYWEPAWPAKAFCGWADDSTKATWTNQGLFSYNGKALGSLSVYSKIRGQ